MCGENLDLEATLGRALKAHPRVGGENCGTAFIAYPILGLIPAWAGKTQAQERRLDHVGLIPACAGKTSKRDMDALDMDGLIPAWAGKTMFAARSD